MIRGFPLKVPSQSSQVKAQHVSHFVFLPGSNPLIYLWSFTETQLNGTDKSLNPAFHGLHIKAHCALVMLSLFIDEVHLSHLIDCGFVDDVLCTVCIPERT